MLRTLIASLLGRKPKPAPPVVATRPPLDISIDWHREIDWDALFQHATLEELLSQRNRMVNRHGMPAVPFEQNERFIDLAVKHGRADVMGWVLSRIAPVHASPTALKVPPAY
ncbi:hypothetical protein SAMN05216466_106144 [Paraburkholderia phenazinium]|uniref:Uncharacterized protein n=1 Tax=Paraburkholderia phenazinium TaxID=60549 RepID=A0A1G7YF82_9BURK|nr:hypothetical protein [Paraburkholderia phenazinium]SDG94580.1 hypothetical protein SAMN05216466_106144 [Paraburkholderia phenazinium]